MTKKLTLIQIRDRTHFDPVKLADTAEVNLVVVYKMLVGDPVKKWQAEDVLKALSELAGGTYTLDTVDVVIAPETETSG